MLIPLASAFAPELAFEQIHRKMDHGRAPMWTCAWRITVFQIRKQGTLFLRRKRLSTLDGQSFADARGNARLDLGLQGGLVFLEIFHQSAQGGGWVCSAEQGRDAAHLEGVRAEWLNRKAETFQNWQRVSNHFGAGRWERDNLGRQQGLRWDAFLRVLQHQLLEQDAFMRSMLVNQVQPIWAFGDEICSTYLTDES
jgi:hypothetical protein